MRIGLTVTFFLLIACCVCAEEPSPQEQRRAIFDRLEEIVDDGGKELPEKLAEANKLLRDSEAIFLESGSEAETRRTYLNMRINYLSLAVRKTGNIEEKNALFDECTQVAEMLEDHGDRKFLLECIADQRRYGDFDPDALRTVEDALNMPKAEWRNDALSIVSQNLSRRTPPDFVEALRAARLIDADANNAYSRVICFSIIAIRQARAGLLDDAEATYRLITHHDLFFNISTLLTFAAIDDERGDVEAAKKRLDAVFDIGHSNFSGDGRGTFVPQFYRYCYSGLVRLKNPELIRYMCDKLTAMAERFDGEFEREEAEYRERVERNNLAGVSGGITTVSTDIWTPRTCRFTTRLVLAKAAAYRNDYEMAERCFQEARLIIADAEHRWNNLENQDRVALIVAFFDAGCEDEARKELDEYVKRFPTGRQYYGNGGGSYWTYPNNLVCELARHNRFAEAVRIAQSISDDEERFRAYDEIMNEIRFRLDEGMDFLYESVQIDPPRKRFSNAREILDIADMLCDEPGGKTLESYRKKIRRYAGKF